MVDDLIKIGLKLKSIRKQLGLTQREISEKYNIHLNTLKSWEWGTKEIGIKRLINYLKIFEDYGVFVHLNSILNLDNNSVPIVQDHNNTQVVNYFLQGLENSNVLFYAEPTGLISYFNSKHKSLLNIKKENYGFELLNLHHLLNTNQINEILTMNVPKKNITLIQPSANSMIQLQLELYTNYDVYNRIVGILGFLLPVLSINKEN